MSAPQIEGRLRRPVPEPVRARVAELFAAGKDSLDIAHACGLRERAVYRILAEQQDVRHALRQQGVGRA